VCEAMPAYFLLAGDGPRREALEELARRTGVGDRVLFLGSRRDIGDVLRASDLSVLSTRPEQETLSVAAIEAMTAGLPVVCTDVGFMREIVLPGKTGELVPVGDAGALAEKIVNLLGDSGLRRRMGEAARALAHERLTVARMAPAFEDLFERLARKESRPCAA
ncbi:MAG: glycosyltransferase, partial [Acidobacteriota bacterium]